MIQKKNPWTRKFAHLLLWMNVISAIIFYFAGPIHSRIHYDRSLWLTVEFRLLILGFNAVAALLIIKGLRFSGAAILFIMGAILFADHVQRQHGIFWAFLFSYWDILVLVLLEWRWRSTWKMRSEKNIKRKPD